MDVTIGTKQNSPTAKITKSGTSTNPEFTLALDGLVGPTGPTREYYCHSCSLVLRKDGRKVALVVLAPMITGPNFSKYFAQISDITTYLANTRSDFIVCNGLYMVEGVVHQAVWIQYDAQTQISLWYIDDTYGVTYIDIDNNSDLDINDTSVALHLI